MRGAGPGRGAWADAAAASRLRLRLRLPLRLPGFCRNASVVKNPVAGIRVFAPNGADLADCSGQAEAALGARASVERPWASGERRGGCPGGRRSRFLSRRSFAASCLSGPIRQNAAEKPRGSPDRIASAWGENRPRCAGLGDDGRHARSVDVPNAIKPWRGREPLSPCRGSAKKPQSRRFNRRLNGFSLDC